jgi:cupin superfamily acireductone dioxygenase involved in methionine salvage
VNRAKREMIIHNYSMAKAYPNTRILTIIACHCDTLLKYKTTVNNIKYLYFKNNDIIVINSKNEKYSDALRGFLEKKI